MNNAGESRGGDGETWRWAQNEGEGVGGNIRHRIASFVGNIWWCMRFLDMEGDGR